MKIKLTNDRAAWLTIILATAWLGLMGQSYRDGSYWAYTALFAYLFVNAAWILVILALEINNGLYYRKWLNFVTDLLVRLPKTALMIGLVIAELGWPLVKRSKQLAKTPRTPQPFE